MRTLFRGAKTSKMEKRVWGGVMSPNFGKDLMDKLRISMQTHVFRVYFQNWEIHASKGCVFESPL